MNIANREIHYLTLTRIVGNGEDQQYMPDEAWLVCRCGFKRSVPLKLDGSFDGTGSVVSQGDVMAEHKYNGKDYGIEVK